MGGNARKGHTSWEPALSITTNKSEITLAASSPLSPFKHIAFSVIWSATVVSNIGSWMYSAASGWLMTSLSPNPLIVSLVQAATTLPMFLFALPAGALADMVDRRRLLLVAEIGLTAISIIFAGLVWLDAVNPVSLLAFAFLAGVGSALTAPAWQSTVPLLVPKPDLQSAVVLNGIGINISRAVGPGLGGILTASFGIAAPFWINAISNFGVIAALVWWRSPRNTDGHLPAERFWGAMRNGFRYARYNPHLRATLMRAFGFFLFASAYWALLPLLARNQIAAGPELYGILLGAIGLGAILGAFAVRPLKTVLGPNRLAAAATIGTATSLVLFGISFTMLPALIASVIAGLSWIAALSSLNVSAQLALSEWVRGRGLALFVVVMFGSMTLGSVIWGQLAGTVGLPTTHFVAAAGALLSIVATWRWKLQTADGLDMAPSMHWPSPITTHEVEQDRGPVLITVEYNIAPESRDEFLAALYQLAQERRRDGAFAWGIYEDTATEGRMVETFMVESWLEHMRQHQRVTNSDRILQNTVHRFHSAGTPKVSHLVFAEMGGNLPMRDAQNSDQDLQPHRHKIA
jgi:predicted MFS family arabinose efflux permease